MNRLARLLSLLLMTIVTAFVAAAHGVGHAPQGANQSTPGLGAPPPEISTAGIPVESPLATELTHVPDVTVETIARTMPRLPAAVAAVYRDNRRGPEVRVIWPAPADNSAVA